MLVPNDPTHSLIFRKCTHPSARKRNQVHDSRLGNFTPHTHLLQRSFEPNLRPSRQYLPRQLHQALSAQPLPSHHEIKVALREIKVQSNVPDEQIFHRLLEQRVTIRHVEPRKQFLNLQSLGIGFELVAESMSILACSTSYVAARVCADFQAEQTGRDGAEEVGQAGGVAVCASANGFPDSVARV